MKCRSASVIKDTTRTVLTQVTRSHGTTLVPRTTWRTQRRTDPRHASKVRLVITERIRVSTTKRQLPGLCVFETERLPVEEFGETFGTVSLVDTLSAGLCGEAEELVGLPAKVELAMLQ